MLVEEKKEIIKQHPAFLGLNEDTITHVATRTQEKIYQPHSTLIHQGDAANAVYFIYKGLIKIYVINNEGKHVPVRTTGEKYFVGDLGVVDDGPVPATVETIQETHVLVMTKEDFLFLINNYPGFAINILKLWAKKVRGNNEQREINFSLQLKDRTLRALQILAPNFPNNEISIAQEELADIVGATRPRVTEVLKDLEKENLIKLSNRNIKIL